MSGLNDFSPLYAIILATIAGGALSMAAAALISFSLLSRWVPVMVSYAVGVLLAAAFLHLVPEAYMQADSIEALSATLLAGLLGFFLLEKAALWRHGHEHPGHLHDTRNRPGLLIVVGDGFHNFVDGVLIAAAFLTDPALGVLTALAIVAHEVPQEVGDFMILLHAGYSRSRALLLNFASSLMAVAGGVTGYFALDNARAATPYVLVLAAASFIYIALADLIPDLHRRNNGRSAMGQLLFVGLGILTILVSQTLLHGH